MKDSFWIKHESKFNYWDYAIYAHGFSHRQDFGGYELMDIGYIPMLICLN